MMATVEVFGLPAAQVLVAGVLFLAAVVTAGVAAWRRWSGGLLADLFAEDVARGADDPAPAGVQEYAADLEQACEGAGPEFLWEMVTAGASRDQARGAWIAELLKQNGGQ